MSFTRLGFTSWQDLLDVLRQVDPAGVAQTPLYVLFGGELPDGHPISERCCGCDAFTSRTLDIELQDVLERQGRWIGRGAAIVMKHRYDFITACHVALHEYAHILIMRTENKTAVALMLAYAPRSCWPDELSDAFDSTMPTKRYKPAKQPELHGSDWLRAMYHLSYRARTLAMVPGPPLIGNYYDEAKLAAFETALGDEPARRIDEPLRDILRSEAPERFAAIAATEKTDERAPQAEVQVL
jgi:hypothetical protein